MKYILKYIGSEEGISNLINKEFIYEEDSDIFEIYEYIQKLLKLRNIDYDLISTLNRLQTYQVYMNNGDLIKSLRSWKSKGNIPYELINLVIERFELKIVKAVK